MTTIEEAGQQSLLISLYSIDAIQEFLAAQQAIIIFVSHHGLPGQSQTLRTRDGEAQIRLERTEHCDLVGLHSIPQNQACSGSMRAHAMSNVANL